jgi:hypothetical protein
MSESSEDKCRKCGNKFEFWGANTCIDCYERESTPPSLLGYRKTPASSTGWVYNGRPCTPPKKDIKTCETCGKDYEFWGGIDCVDCHEAATSPIKPRYESELSD